MQYAYVQATVNQPKNGKQTLISTMHKKLSFSYFLEKVTKRKISFSKRPCVKNAARIFFATFL